MAELLRQRKIDTEVGTVRSAHRLVRLFSPVGRSGWRVRNRQSVSTNFSA